MRRGIKRNLVLSNYAVVFHYTTRATTQQFNMHNIKYNIKRRRHVTPQGGGMMRSSQASRVFPDELTRFKCPAFNEELRKNIDPFMPTSEFNLIWKTGCTGYGNQTAKYIRYLQNTGNEHAFSKSCSEGLIDLSSEQTLQGRTLRFNVTLSFSIWETLTNQLSIDALQAAYEEIEEASKQNTDFHPTPIVLNVITPSHVTICGPNFEKMKIDEVIEVSERFLNPILSLEIRKREMACVKDLRSQFEIELRYNVTETKLVNMLKWANVRLPCPEFIEYLRSNHCKMFTDNIKCHIQKIPDCKQNDTPSPEEDYSDKTEQSEEESPGGETRVMKETKNQTTDQIKIKQTVIPLKRIRPLLQYEDDDDSSLQKMKKKRGAPSVKIITQE